jgi:hypothetical protein
MAYSNMRWISTPTFLACVGATHGRGEGVNVCKGARTVEVGARTAEEVGTHTSWGGHMRPSASRMRPTIFRMHPLRRRMHPSDRHMHPFDRRMCPSASVCVPPTCVFAPPLAYAPIATPTIQHGSDVAATVDIVSPDLPCPRSTRR